MGYEESNTPLVSVIMSVKNAETTIRESIDSILNQTIEKLECIIVDDNSTDSTRAILEDYQKGDSRINFQTNPGQGVCDARNYGIALTKAPLYAVMDADDISLPDRLLRQYEQFQTNDNLVLLGTFYHTFSGEASDLTPITMPTDNNSIKESVLTIPTFGHPTIMARIEAVREIGGYRKFFEGAEDHDLYLRMSPLGDFSVIPEFHLYYRTHPAQFSQVRKAKGYRASVASAYCFSCTQENQTDPSITRMTCKEIVFELLEKFSERKDAIKKGKIKLYVRAILGLSEFSELTPKILAVRRRIIFRLLINMQFRVCNIFWKSTRRKKWLSH